MKLTQKEGSNSYIRWNRSERWQHWTLAISFIILVITGFALKYPDTWWVRLYASTGWFFEMRGLLHRIAGAVFLFIGVYHAYYMFATERGRALGKSLLLNRDDLRHLRQNVSYNLGLTKTPPHFRHFSYMEKAEYWALIWGSVIMGLTGLMLWFEWITLTFFPKWIIDLMTVIHLYEAWLATLAIVVWHFYYVIFNPDIYPLNTTMVDGRITDEQLRHEYFLEWQEMQSPENGESTPEDETTDDEPVTENKDEAS